jgi:putative endonuclease
MNNKEKGNRGEALAREWLQQQGFRILATNWRHGRAEVDVIACRQELLVFVEVKMRTGMAFGYPEEAVSTAKLNLLKQAAEAYQYQHPQWRYIRFDVLAITLLPGQPPAYFYIEDVY